MVVYIHARKRLLRAFGLSQGDLVVNQRPEILVGSARECCDDPPLGVRELESKSCMNAGTHNIGNANVHGQCRLQTRVADTRKGEFGDVLDIRAGSHGFDTLMPFA
jgi:hypothetical protein